MAVDRRTAVVLLVGAIGVLALVLSAATLTDVTGSSEGPGWINLGPDEDSQGEVFTGDFEVPIIGSYLDSLWTVLVVGVVLITLYGLLALDRKAFLRLLVVNAGVLAVFAGLHWLISGTSMGGISNPFNRSQPNATGVSIDTGGSATPGNGLSVYILGAGVLVGLLAVLAIVYQTGDDLSEEPGAEDNERKVDEPLQSVGEAAGRAADSIAEDGATPSNAVYRAWVEMTAALAVKNRESTTPGEFAEVAVEAGMDSDDVRELTRLFEDVRYGDEPPSEERTEQARAALRRIEAAYAGEER